MNTHFSSAIQRYHTRSSLRPNNQGRTGIDWTKQPHPFRSYPGAPIVALPHPETKAGSPWPSHPARAAEFNLQSIATLLFHSAAVAVWKKDPRHRATWPLRINPSAGNLHPEEIYLAADGIKGLEDGIYHFNVEHFQLERRLTMTDDLRRLLGAVSRTGASLKVLISVIPERSSWKYEERAFRYCLLDAGHCEAALRTAAVQMGWPSVATRTLDDRLLALPFGLKEVPEVPLTLIEFGGAPLNSPGDYGNTRLAPLGIPNQLIVSGQPLTYPAIDEVIAETAGASSSSEEVCRDDFDGVPLPHFFAQRDWKRLVRGRRSAVAFNPSVGCTFEYFNWILKIALQQSGYWRMGSLEREWATLYVFAHRVNGLASGLYRLDASSLTLNLVRAGGMSYTASFLSHQQNIAADGAFAVVMTVDESELSSLFGPKGYRLGHQSAGRIGQGLYLAAESVGFSATGIGAFFDEEIRHSLELGPESMPVYNLAVGKAVPDERLQDLPAYPFMAGEQP